MEIKGLKQPYRRMAEYLADKNPDEFFKDKKVLSGAFCFRDTDDSFWDDVNRSKHPPITEEIKKHFPPDFDFSGEDDTKDKFKNVEIPFNFNIFNSMLKKEVKDTFYLDAKEYYTQLAKEGKFDKLPDTCEFSEAVELEVSDCNEVFKTLDVVGKFKGKFVEKENISCVGYTLWNFAKLPTPKIDFSEFKAGYVVEVETNIEIKSITKIK